MIRRAAIWLILTSLLAAGAPLTAPAPMPRPSIAPPDAAALVAEARLSGDVAYLLYDLDARTVVEARLAELPLPPASVAKAPTALYALDRLGPDFRFETRLITSGTVANGVLKGDLILQGGGDPELDTVDLDALAVEAARIGLKRVDGRFLVDDTLLPVIEQIDDTQPVMAAYNPSVSAMNLNFNRIHAEWKRTSAGYDMKVEARSEGLSPPSSAATVQIVDATTSGQIFDYARAENVERWSVARKALGRGGARWLPVRDAARYAGLTFRDVAKARGISLPMPEIGAAPTIADVIARHASRPVARISRDMLRYSTNLTAETLGLMATRAGGGTPSGLEGSASAMGSWARRFATMPPGSMALVNHSGLSGASRTTASSIAALMISAAETGFAAPAGEPSSLFDLMAEFRIWTRDDPAPPVEAIVKAKTGTLNFTSALAGYLVTEQRRRFAFAILTADLDRRAALASSRAEAPRGARGWAGRSRQLQRDLLKSWVARFGRAEG
ncbi:MAG: D-alanyl-D-alanine carboxypeptidase/D-alanyl-D-alanine-endopeptidase [Pseudomonadota bacterium]